VLDPLIQVRRARRDEADPIAAVWLRSRYASIPANPAPVHSDDDVHLYFAAVVLPNAEVWVADAEGAIVALMALDGDEVDHLHVDPDHTGKGLGSRLIDVAKAEHPGGLALWTFQSNVGARRFYERHGFVAIAMTDGDNEEGMPDVRYQWVPPATVVC
jgi:GNAT superfamily N-acetyltransferase